MGTTFINGIQVIFDSAKFLGEGNYFRVGQPQILKSIDLC